MSKLMQFRLLRGQHIEGVRGADGKPALHPYDGSKLERVYHAGDVIETTVDLAARFNHPECAEQKFERLVGGIEAAKLDPDTHEVWDRSKETLDQFCQRVGGKSGDTPVTVAAKVGSGVIPTVSSTPTGDRSTPDKPLEKMSHQELRAFAAEEEIDISKCRTQQETLQVIRKACGPIAATP